MRPEGGGERGCPGGGFGEWIMNKGVTPFSTLRSGTTCFAVQKFPASAGATHDGFQFSTCKAGRSLLWVSAGTPQLVALPGTERDDHATVLPTGLIVWWQTWTSGAWTGSMRGGRESGRPGRRWWRSQALGSHRRGWALFWRQREPREFLCLTYWGFCFLPCWAAFGISVLRPGIEH